MKRPLLRPKYVAVSLTAALTCLTSCFLTDHLPDAPQPIPATSDFLGSSFETPVAQPTPSTLPSLIPTITSTATIPVAQTPSPAPSPTFSPFAWACVDDGTPDPCHRAFRDIAMRTADDGWVVGERGVILHWDGTVFTRVDSPADITLRRVAALSAGDAWALGDTPAWTAAEGMVWQSEWLRWDGTVWRIFQNPDPVGSVVDFSFVSGEDGWAITQNGSPSNLTYSLCRWNGNTWVRFSDAPALHAIDMIATDNGWAVGEKGAILHWDGARWAAVDSPTEKDLNGVSFISPDIGWVISSQGEIIRFSGGQWLTYSGLAPAPRVLALDPGGGGWILGLWQSGDVMLYWNGSEWVKYLGAFPDGEVLSMATPAAGQGWAVGWIPGRSRTGMIWRWTSKGWVRALDLRAFAFRAANILSGDAMWAAGDNGVTAFWNGSKWSEVDNPTSQSLNTVHFLSSEDGWTAGEGGQIMHWDGNIWKVIEPYQWPAEIQQGEYPHIEDLGFLSVNDGWAVGRKDGTNIISPLLYHWDGTAWTDTDLGDASSLCQCELTAVHFFSAQEGWAVGGGEVGLFAHWTGKEWQLSRGPDGVKLLAIGGSAANDVWAAGVVTSGDQTPYPGVILHYDGETWTEFVRPTDVTWLDALWIPNGGEGWLAGNGILHWTGSLWGFVPSPVDSTILSVSKTADGRLWGVTDNGVVLQLMQR